MFFWKKNKINKKFLGAKTVDVPKTAQKTIPFQEAYENGLFLNYDGSYSLIFSFENIDYSLYRDEEKQRWQLWYNGRNGVMEYIGYAVHEGLALE